MNKLESIRVRDALYRQDEVDGTTHPIRDRRYLLALVDELADAARRLLDDITTSDDQDWYKDSSVYIARAALAKVHS